MPVITEAMVTRVGLTDAQPASTSQPARKSVNLKTPTSDSQARPRPPLPVLLCAPPRLRQCSAEAAEASDSFCMCCLLLQQRPHAWDAGALPASSYAMHAGRHESDW